MKTITLILLLLLLLPFHTQALDKDKELRIEVSTSLAWNLSRYMTKRTTMAACMAVGLGKELYGEYDYGGFDDEDLLADFAGCTLGMLGYQTEKFMLSPKEDGIQLTYKF